MGVPVEEIEAKVDLIVDELNVGSDPTPYVEALSVDIVELIANEDVALLRLAAARCESLLELAALVDTVDRATVGRLSTLQVQARHAVIRLEAKDDVEAEERETRVLADRILDVLGQGPSRTGELARALDTDESQVSRALRGLRADGRVEPAPAGSGDQRGRWYQLLGGADVPATEGRLVSGRRV